MSVPNKFLFDYAGIPGYQFGIVDGALPAESGPVVEYACGMGSLLEWL